MYLLGALVLSVTGPVYVTPVSLPLSLSRRYTCLEVQDHCDVIPIAGTCCLVFLPSEGRETSPFLARIAYPRLRHFCESFTASKTVFVPDI